jgi:hypothetical protein
MRVFRTPYVADWEENKQEEIRKLTSAGVLPHEANVKQIESSGKEVSPSMMIDFQPMLMGQVAGNIEDVKSAQVCFRYRSGSLFSVLTPRANRRKSWTTSSEGASLSSRTLLDRSTPSSRLGPLKSRQYLCGKRDIRSFLGLRTGVARPVVLMPVNASMISIHMLPFEHAQLRLRRRGL